jgi:2-dehydropantoate 2-reductase
LSFDQVIIFGAGAVGSYLGARLSRVASTVLVARPAHAEAVARDGLRIGGLTDERVHIAARTDCPEAAAGALVIVGVKMGGLAEAGAALRPRLREDTIVAAVQNGIGPDRALSEALGRRAVARIIVNMGVSMEGPGRIAYWSGRGVTLGPGAIEDRLAAFFERAGLVVGRCADVKRAEWEKLASNCVANPLTALTGLRNRGIITRDLTDLRHSLVAEVAALAAAEGVALSSDLAGRIDAALAESNNENSMAQDVRFGRTTEIDWLNGYVARRSEERGLPAPMNRALAELVRIKCGGPRAAAAEAKP